MNISEFISTSIDYIRDPFVFTLFLYLLFVFFLQILFKADEEKRKVSVTHFRLESWRDFAYHILLLIVVNCVVSGILGFLIAVSNSSSLITSLNGSLGGVFAGLFGFMVISMSFGILFSMLEVIGKTKYGLAQDFSKLQIFKVSHTLGVIAGLVCCPIGTILWFLQSNIFSEFTVADLYARNNLAILRLYFSAFFGGIQLAMIVLYFKSVAQRFLPKLDLSKLLKSSLMTVLVVVVAFIGIFLSVHQISDSKFYIEALQRHDVAFVLTLWFGYIAFFFFSIFVTIPLVKKMYLRINSSDLFKRYIPLVEEL